MSNEIRFPSKMEVESPKTDALIDAQIKAFSALSKNLETGFSNLLGGMKTLERMPDLMVKFQTQVGEQLATMFTHQIEASMFARHATLLSISRTAKALDGLLQEKTQQLTPDRERIIERYRELLGKVAKQCEERIRELDAHALSLIEDVYPTHVQQLFSFVSTPSIGLMSDHHRRVAEQRRDALASALSSVRERLVALRTLARVGASTLEQSSRSATLEQGWFEIPALRVSGKLLGKTEPVRSSEAQILVDRRIESGPLAARVKRAPAPFVTRVLLQDDDKHAIRSALRRRGRGDLADALT